MVRTKTALALGAAIGLLIGNPALAASTRSGDALPRTNVASLDVSRASAPVADANEANPRRSLLLALFAAIGAVGLLVVADSGGGNDSPG